MRVTGSLKWKIPFHSATKFSEILTEISTHWISLHILFFDLVNDYVGFGLMDASKMVEVAVNWSTVPPKVTCTIPRLHVYRYDGKYM